MTKKVNTVSDLKLQMGKQLARVKAIAKEADV